MGLSSRPSLFNPDVRCKEAGQYTFKRQLVWIGLNLLIELNIISCLNKIIYRLQKPYWR